MKTRTARTVLLPTAVLAALVALTGCGSGTSTTAESGSAVGESAPTASATDDATGNSEDAADEAMISADDRGFTPGDLTVPAGTSVTVVNDGNMEHSLVIEGTDINSGTIPAGESFTFTLDDPGVYEYICDLHPTMGGTITVE